jgi:hypothetical protein
MGSRNESDHDGQRRSTLSVLTASRGVVKCDKRLSISRQPSNLVDRILYFPAFDSRDDLVGAGLGMRFVW